LTKTKENEKKGALLWSLVLQHSRMRLEDTAAPTAYVPAEGMRAQPVGRDQEEEEDRGNPFNHM
jgi:hypothetical protein